jgi:hypothetical protein
LEFCVAPRLMHIQQVVSTDSTSNRGIFHTKNEPLAGGGYHRLHILCGESLCSETAIVLKVGATALVTAMAEEGLKPGAEMRLASPLDTLYAVSSDPTCTRKHRLAAGGEATAIEIQRRLLQIAERNCSVLPSWGADICALWGRTLDQLEAAPDSVTTVLDWAIKHRLLRDRAERCGVPWERFAFLNSILKRLNAALAGVSAKGRHTALSVVLGPHGPVPEETARIGSLLAKERLAWSDFEQFLKLRDEFYQIDTRFGQIGPRGIFSEMDRSGVLDHKVAAIDGVDAAMCQPPAVGRAKLRGETARRLSGQVGAGCSWVAVFAPDGRTLDLRDPFTTAEVWNDSSTPNVGNPPRDVSQYDLFGDPGPFHQMFDAVRRRCGRRGTRAQGPPETTEGLDS